MTENRTLLFVWTAFILLMSGFIIAEYQFFKAQPAISPLRSGFANPILKKCILDYTTIQKETARLQEKNKILMLAYTPAENAQPTGIKQPSSSEKKIERNRSKRKRPSVVRKKTIQRAPVRKRQLLRRRRQSVQAKPSQPLAVYKGKSSPLRRKPLKNVTIKVSNIRPAPANASWKKLQREPLFTWPVDSSQFWVSSLFGPRKLGGRRGFHAGVDLAAVRGTPVYAAGAGVVEEACYSSGYGNYILIAHNRKFKTRYAHLDKILVRVGQSVCSGDCIGRVGATGFVRKSRRGGSASHLHFEVYMKGKPVNPFFFLA